LEFLNKGEIKKIEKNYGTISSISKEDLMFDMSELFYKEPNIGDNVSFNLSKNNIGKYYASNIQLLERTKKNIKSSNSKYKFLDKNDFKIAYKLINDKLNYQLSKKDFFDHSDKIASEITDITDILKDLNNGVEPNINSVNLDQINNYEPSNTNREDNNYWLNNFDIKNFGRRISELGKLNPLDKAKVKKDYTIIWGEWRSESIQTFDYGYHKDHFRSSYINANQNERTTTYYSIPPKAKWKVTKIDQKGQTFYISSASVDEIAQASYVPSLPTKLEVSNTAKRILNTNFKPNEWQRGLESKRSLKISQFIQESSNIVANTPMLFVNRSHAVNITNDELIIDFKKFLKKKIVDNEEVWVDRIEMGEDEAGNQTYLDHRPLWLVDGQHRIKGIHNSVKPHFDENMHEIKVPIIIFPNEFGEEKTAKVFAEINTLQKKLHPLHELFMQHRFKIDHESENRKFKDYKKFKYLEAVNRGWGKEWLDSRANHLSYEIAALLASKGVLKDQIQFLPQNDKTKTLVSADQWVNYCRSIFFNCYERKTGGISSWINNPSDEELKLKELHFFYTEMNNYFQAWIEICNHDEWNKDKTKSWKFDLTTKRSLIQKNVHFIILLEVYSMVWMKAKENMTIKSQSRILLKDDFAEVLKVFKWVDWTNRDLSDIYPSSGEIGRRSLEAWMADAILNGESFKYKEIHCYDEENQINKHFNKSKPGRGIYSFLDEPEIDGDLDDWPSPEKSLKFKSKRPSNARYEATWSVLDEKDNLIIEKKSLIRNKYFEVGTSIFILKHSRDIDNLDMLKIQVEWKNSHPRTGRNHIEIFKN
tara:strand:- start:1630 stop:4083 length:2454 start_codon:yes stop_codon:yes gene_type:complete